MTARADLHQAGERIQQLLDEIKSTGDLRVGSAADELVRALTTLYGAGLERVLQTIEEEGGSGVLDALAQDELVSSLLILHGLHPLDTRARVEAGINRVQPYLASHGGAIEIISLADDGVLRLRLKGSCDGCGASTMTIKHAVEVAILELAPEVVALDVEGLPRPLYEESDVIPVQSVARPQRLSDWLTLPLAPLPEGHVLQLGVGGKSLLICRAQGNLYAYDDECAGCHRQLRQDSLTKDLSLLCSDCGASFDVRLAGRQLDSQAAALQPIPLIEVEGGIRLALNGEA